MEEQDLVNLLNENSQKGIEAIIERYSGLVYCLIRNKVSGVCSSQDIEECVSDVFFALFRQRDRIDLTKAKLQTYICVIAKRKAITLYQKTLKKGNTVLLADVDMNKCQDDVLYLDESYIHKENRKILLSAINQLGEIDRQIIIRKFLILQSSKEISELLGMTANAVDLRVHRALRKLKTEIQKKEM